MKHLLLLAGLGCAVSETKGTSDQQVSAAGRPLLVSNAEKSGRMWVIFPEQRELHQTAMQRRLGDEPVVAQRSAGVELDESFWTAHRELLELADDSEMVLARSWEAAGGAVTHKKYNQNKLGYRVHGGEFVATIGAHGGVMRMNGLPIGMPAPSDALKKAGISEQAAIRALQKHIAGDEMSPEAMEITFTAPVEKVWFNSLYSVAAEGEISLAFRIAGIVSKETGVDSALAFESFISAATGEVLEYIDKTTQISPFSYPLQDATIKVKDDFSGEITFDTTDSPYTYPKPNDPTLNTMVDNTMYTKNMFYSLSNGEMQSWAGRDTLLKITYNLTDENAYFDGSGIQFGKKFTTDDVVVHEWAHGYTDTLAGLVYRYEPGALNEAFSDIFGEAVDVLNKDTTDEETLRTVWPVECRSQLDGQWGQTAGSDLSARWALGEDVTVPAENAYDGALRDMYSPNCYLNAESTYSPFYACLAPEADFGGVHLNSAVPNRLFAVLVDGGEYEDRDGGSNIVVEGIGFNKALNLMYRTLEALTSTSQFMDFAMELEAACDDNIGADIFYPNLLNYTIYIDDEMLTVNDCTQVKAAIQGSGMASSDNFCPNIDCESNRCKWATCAAADYVFSYETFDINGLSSLPVPCAYFEEASVARVFQQIKGLEVSCIEFSSLTVSSKEMVLSLYVDSTGGAPDIESMTLAGSMSVPSIHSRLYPQMQTVTFDPPVSIDFPNGDATLVVVLSFPYVADAWVLPSGNSAATSSLEEETFFGGSCMGNFGASDLGYLPYADYYSGSVQWHVSLSGSKSSDENDNVCFAADSMVALADGSNVRMSDLKVGDAVWVLTDEGAIASADVVFLPHQVNTNPSQFIRVETSGGHVVRATPKHLFPVGTCGSADWAFIQAADIITGLCVNTITGPQQVVAVNTEELDGVYTFVTSARSGRILVDGIEASSFGLHHDAANTYYMLHRVGYSVLRAMGLSATVVHDIMTHDVLVATNLFIGDLSLLAAKAFAII